MTDSKADSPNSNDYKATLNLPVTDFPMRAGLPQREPEQVERWLKDRVYYRMVERNRAAKAPRFLLHDGPPYANGNIHLGHVLNKVLKDVVIKYKNICLLYTSPSPRDLSTSRMPSSA